MHKEQQRQHLESNNSIISKLAVIVLSIVLLTGISLVPALQIGVNGQVQQQQQQQQQQPNKVIEASGHFANNQIENGTVTWIQGGLWHLDI
jgi:hypothetical protein